MSSCLIREVLEDRNGKQATVGYAPEVWEGYGRAGVKRPFYGTVNMYNRILLNIFRPLITFFLAMELFRGILLKNMYPCLSIETYRML